MNTLESAHKGLQPVRLFFCLLTLNNNTMKPFSREAKQKYISEHMSELTEKSFEEYYNFFHQLIKAQEKKANAENYVKKSVTVKKIVVINGRKREVESSKLEIAHNKEEGMTTEKLDKHLEGLRELYKKYVLTEPSNKNIL